MQNNIEYKETGLKCDNPECGWKDETIPFEETEQWVNKPCPQCGQNVLTQEDYEQYALLIAGIKLINSMTLDEVNAMAAGVDLEALKASGIFADGTSDHLLNTEDPVTGYIEVHNGVKITEVKRIEN